MKLPTNTGKKKHLTDSEELEIHFELIGFFRKEKPYLNPDLSLNEVEKKSTFYNVILNHTGYTPKKIVETLNQKSN